VSVSAEVDKYGCEERKIFRSRELPHTRLIPPWCTYKVRLRCVHSSVGFNQIEQNKRVVYTRTKIDGRETKNLRARFNALQRLFVDNPKWHTKTAALTGSGCNFGTPASCCQLFFTEPYLIGTSLLRVDFGPLPKTVPLRFAVSLMFRAKSAHCHPPPRVFNSRRLARGAAEVEHWYRC
jgi:hypothetical protein